MKENITELRVNRGTCYIKREGNFLHVYNDKVSVSLDRHDSRIKIPLFYQIALYTKERRSYKSVLRKFFDELKAEGILSIKSRETLERAGRACGSCGGGGTAWLLGVFCRYYRKIPRNINVVKAVCEKCKSSTCGNKIACGNYYGCGDGVLSPLERGFKVKDIPILREEIKVEDFPKP